MLNHSAISPDPREYFFFPPLKLLYLFIWHECGRSEDTWWALALSFRHAGSGDWIQVVVGVFTGWVIFGSRAITWASAFFWGLWYFWCNRCSLCDIFVKSLYLMAWFPANLEKIKTFLTWVYGRVGLWSTVFQVLVMWKATRRQCIRLGENLGRVYSSDPRTWTVRLLSLGRYWKLSFLSFS